MSFHYAFLLVLAGYVLATMFYLLRVVTGRSILAAVGLRLTVFVALFQAILLFVHWHKMPGEAFSSYLDYFQTAALLLAVIFIGLCFFRRYFALGPFILPMIVILVNASLTISNPFSLMMTEKGSGYLVFHLIAIFLALVAFILSFTSAVAYLLLDLKLKKKQMIGWALKLPPLAEIENTHYKSLVAGFILLSFAILTGAGYEKMKTGHYLSGALKESLGYIAWFFLAILLNLRLKFGWRGHRGIIIALAGLILVALLFVVGFS